jgi:uncharacterized membrane protein YebE (DUF533 family)
MKTLSKLAVGMAELKQAQHGPGDQGGLSDLANAPGGFAEATAPFEGAGNPLRSGAVPGVLNGLLLGQNTAGHQLGDLLESLDDSAIQEKLSGLAGKSGASGVLGSLLSMVGRRPPDKAENSFGRVLNSAFDQADEPEIPPNADQEAAAALLLRAMINAAQSDGELDDRERDKLMGHLGGDLGAEEAAFVQAEILSPVDMDTLVAQTPPKLAPQVYAISVLGIDLDRKSEAQYLDKLARRFGMSTELVNHIHQRLGVPPLYM